MRAVVAIEGLSVIRGRRQVLHVPRLMLGARDLLVVMGPNGAGKSTLLRVCLGLQRYAGGTVRVFDQRLDTAGPGRSASLRRRMGYVPQVFSARSETPLTVREVVMMGVTAQAGLCRRLTGAHRRSVDTWLERLGLGELAERGYAELSGGQQRKVLIARAMASRPELLVLDEPTAHLDLGWREQMVRTVEDLYEREGVSVLLACHEMEVIPPSCRRVMLLRDGEVAAEGPPEQVWTDARVASLYGPGLRVSHYGGRHAVVPAGDDDA